MLNLEEKIRNRITERGITMKFLASQIGVTEAGLSKMLKNNTMKVETLTKVSEVLGVDPTYWYKTEATSQSATGIGNAAGESNKLRVNIGAKPDKPEAKRLNELMMDLLKCEKEREIYRTERDSYARECDTYKSMVAQQAQVIERLSAR